MGADVSADSVGPYGEGASDDWRGEPVEAVDADGVDAASALSVVPSAAASPALCASAADRFDRAEAEAAAAAGEGTARPASTREWYADSSIKSLKQTSLSVPAVASM